MIFYWPIVSAFSEHEPGDSRARRRCERKFMPAEKQESILDAEEQYPDGHWEYPYGHWRHPEWLRGPMLRWTSHYYRWAYPQWPRGDHRRGDLNRLIALLTIQHIRDHEWSLSPFLCARSTETRKKNTNKSMRE